MALALTTSSTLQAARRVFPKEKDIYRMRWLLLHVDANIGPKGVTILDLLLV